MIWQKPSNLLWVAPQDLTPLLKVVEFKFSLTTSSRIYISSEYKEEQKYGY